MSKFVEALQFYADAWKSKSNKLYGGLEWSPTEALLDDCGNRAKEAIAAISAKPTEPAVTEPMVEAALAAWYPGEWPDDVIFQSLEVGSENSETFGDHSKRDMRAALEAALAAREAAQ